MKKIIYFLALFAVISLILSCNKSDDPFCDCNGHNDTIYVSHYDTVVVNNYDTIVVTKHDTVVVNNTDDYYIRINVAYTDYTINNDYRDGSYGLRHIFCNNEFNEQVDYISLLDYDASNTAIACISLGPVKQGFKATVKCVESKARPIASAPWTIYSDERVPSERNNIQISISKNREPFTIVKEGIGQLEYTIE